MKLYIDTENKIIHCYNVMMNEMETINRMIEAAGGDPKEYRVFQEYVYQPYVQPMMPQHSEEDDNVEINFDDYFTLIPDYSTTAKGWVKIGTINPCQTS